jgi:hypothetical protein
MDYVYIPLGGSRASTPRIYMNLMVTMFISGLWHGAGLNFIVWGLLHGLMLAVHRLWRHGPGAVPSTHVMARAFSWAITFVGVNLAWAFFVWMFIRRCTFSGALFWGEAMTRLAWCESLLEYLAGERDEAPAGFPVHLGNFWFWGIWWCVLIAIVFIFSGQSSKFIYIDF